MAGLIHFKYLKVFKKYGAIWIISVCNFSYSTLKMIRIIGDLMFLQNTKVYVRSTRKSNATMLIDSNVFYTVVFNYKRKTNLIFF